MKFRYTFHAEEKFEFIRNAGFDLDKYDIELTLSNPDKLEDKHDGTYIATKILDSKYILRVVYRLENDIIVVITFYPAKRSKYAI